jgi:hypothetical protein
MVASKDFGTSLNDYIIKMGEKGRRSDGGRVSNFLYITKHKAGNRKPWEELRLKSKLILCYTY